MFNQKNEEKETTVSSIETKQNRLLLDLQILSNLNNKPSDSFNTYLNKSFTDTETETSKKKKSSLIFSPIPENYDFDKNFQNSNNYNMSLNISGKNYTNFNYVNEKENELADDNYNILSLEKTRINLSFDIGNDKNYVIAMDKDALGKLIQDLE